MFISRLMDTTIGVCVGHTTPIPATGFVITSQMTVMANGLPVARLLDTVISTCGHTGVIVSGSPKVFISGLPAARFGSQFVGTYTGIVIGSSSNVFCS